MDRGLLLFLIGVRCRLSFFYFFCGTTYFRRPLLIAASSATRAAPARQGGGEERERGGKWRCLDRQRDPWVSFVEPRRAIIREETNIFHVKHFCFSRETFRVV
jgi:hypothetical protein